MNIIDCCLASSEQYFSYIKDDLCLINQILVHNSPKERDVYVNEFLASCTPVPPTRELLDKETRHNIALRGKKRVSVSCV